MSGTRHVRAVIPLFMIALLAFSVISFSGLAAAGRHYTGPTGNVKFDKSSYSLGQSMSITISGSGGAGGTKAYFEFVLKNPSGSVVMRSQLYWAVSFTDIVHYTLKTTDKTGYWTGELSYNVEGKRRVVMTVLANVETVVVP